LGLYKRLRKLEQRHWLETATRRTWIPFLVVLISFSSAGYAYHAYSPESNTAFEALHLAISNIKWH